MRKVLIIPILAVASLVVTGCGSSSSESPASPARTPSPKAAKVTATSLATSLQREGDWQGALVDNVICARKTDHLFSCMGDYTATITSLKKQGIDIKEYTAEELKQMTQPERTSWEVTVDDDGSWVTS